MNITEVTTRVSCPHEPQQAVVGRGEGSGWGKTAAAVSRVSRTERGG